MKRWQLFTSTLLMTVLFSASSSYAIPMEKNQTNAVQYKEQIKEKKQVIKHHLKENKKLEKQAEKKIKKIDDLMLYLPENRVVGLESVKGQLNEMQKSVQGEFNEINKVEARIWDFLNAGGIKTKDKDYASAVKYLNMAIEALEKKHDMLVKYDKSLDELMKFLQSVELK